MLPRSSRTASCRYCRFQKGDCFVAILDSQRFAQTPPALREFADFARKNIRGRSSIEQSDLVWRIRAHIAIS